MYARLSFAANGDTINVDDQVEWCSEEVAARGARVGEVFKDNSLSAWKPSVVRPEWDRLMDRLETRQSHGVMVLDLTRFSRKVMEGERLIDMAAKGLVVWSLSGSYDLTTADGRRHFREAMVAAAGESDKISERVKRGMERRAKKGRDHGGARGWAMTGLVPVPADWEPGDPRERVSAEQVDAEREVVRECYRRLLAGESLSSLVRELNSRGLRTVDGNPWRRNALSQSLRRASMAGLVEMHGQVVGTLVDAQPVVSREEWERLCALFEARKLGRPAGKVHMLAGLIHCGQCGARLLGTYRAGLPPYPDGSRKREYRCRRNADHPHGCGKTYMDGKIADAAVGEAVRARLGDPRHADQIAKRLAKASQQRDRINAEIHQLDQSADDLAEKTARWGAARVDKAMAPILRRIDGLHVELAKLDEPASTPAAVVDAVRDWNEAEQRGDLDTLRAMVRRAFPRLTLRPPAYYRDHSVGRFDWDGATLPA
ncbi:MAG TPA: recombinase family protein [Pseudonocardiaceae bacterium]|nr:recombinase family protein [Pseudonocardiaceae bacterium]